MSAERSTPLPLLEWRAPVRVVPFPIVRNAKRVTSAARNAARFSDDTAIRMVDAAADKHAARLIDIGVEHERAEKEAQAFRIAMRCALACCRGAK